MLLILPVSIGCSGKSAIEPGAPVAVKATPPAAAKPAVTRVSDRPANINGAVLVPEYHHMGDRKDPMFRPTEGFKNDLLTYYRLGFRPITAEQYLSNKFDLAPGASPIVITFDDSNAEQFRLTADGRLDPTCMLGIWQTFAKDHPDFPVRATFFVLPGFFGQSKWKAEKFALLNSLGCEIANHTITHPILRHLDDAKVKAEIGGGELAVRALGVKGPIPLALPFGSSPRNRSLLTGFDWKGTAIKPSGVFLVGANPAKSPSDSKFDRLSIARIQANDLPLGTTDWLKQVESGRVKVYVAP